MKARSKIMQLLNVVSIIFLVNRFFVMKPVLFKNFFNKFKIFINLIKQIFMLINFFGCLIALSISFALSRIESLEKRDVTAITCVGWAIYILCAKKGDVI